MQCPDEGYEHSVHWKKEFLLVYATNLMKISSQLFDQRLDALLMMKAKFE